MTVLSSEWFKAIRRYITFPDNYLVFDCETSGLSPATELVVQLGYCIVVGREAVASGAIMLDWTRQRCIDQNWLSWRMAATAKAMAADGKPCHMSYDRMHNEGIPPFEALAILRQLVVETRERGDSFLAHNGWGFDVPMLMAQYSRFYQPGFVFGPDEIYDTGMLVKANLTNTFPLRGETKRDFYKRVGDKRRKGVKWSLNDFCVPALGLVEKHSLNVDDGHDAGYDTKVTHYVFEAIRELVEAGTPVINTMESEITVGE